MVSSSYVRNSLVAVVLASAGVANTRNWNPIGEGCVDTDGFLACYQARVDDAAGCVRSCDSTTIFNVCPTSDLSLFGIDNDIATAQGLLQQSKDNCAILETSPDACVAELGFPYAGTKIVNLLNLPTGIPGSDPLVNNPGNPLTDFGLASYTLSLFPAYSTVIKPAAFNTKAGAGAQTFSGTITAKVSGTASAVNTGTGAAAAASPNKTSNAMREHAGFWVVVFVLLSTLI
ncbi:hypothetical protein BKA65DRAFT_594710 [Rhexocercosporidium sp. MPI-PUGE-AT-0058]|nr:hypothetical protein BKA65DRAFT_594710 [Rhexocercosporidium sp. MPI-PUGE-AT-0058]